jgi:hypothetical protein
MLNASGAEVPGSPFEQDARHEEMQVNLYLYEPADSDWTRALEFR